MRTNSLVWIGIFFLVMETKAQTITDIDGNTYNTIVIGTQTWMKENLRATRFNNGDSIPTTSMPVNNDSTSIYQWSYNEDPANVSIYGRLYTWYTAAGNRNVCPVDWHVPDASEWITLSGFLGGDTVAGSKMKEVGTDHWSGTDFSVDNSSGFTGLPGGFRGNPGGFNQLGRLGNFWSSTIAGSNSFARGSVFALHYDNKTLSQSVAVANCGLSIRCVKGLATKSESLPPGDKTRIRIFPNPATDKINISFEGAGSINISIYTVTGALVLEQQPANNTSLIDLDFLPKGVYIIKIVGADFTIARKLIKE